ATDIFLTQGYGASSIEAVARRARISKRTLYSRFRDKPDLFNAVIHYIVERLRPPQADKLFKGASFEDVLERIAEAILHASLNPQAIALQRLILSEASNFPELATAVAESGARDEAIRRIADLLEHEKHLNLKKEDMRFAAEQFLQMVVSAPQRRAMGL